MRARSSERTSCPVTTGARPQPDSVSPLRPNTPPIYQGCGAATDSARERSVFAREPSARRVVRESGATGGDVSPAQLLDQSGPAHAEQLGCLFLVELRPRQGGTDVRVLELAKHRGK